MQIEQKTLEELETMQEACPVVGVFKVTDEDYHSFKAISSSAIRQAAISMAHFNSYFNPDENMPEEKRADFFSFGSAFHAYVLDMDEFDKSFVLKPNLDFRTKEGKAWKADNAHRHILSELDMYKIQRMAKSVKESAFWNDFTKDEYYTEIAMFWVDQITGLHCKSKIDLLSPSLGILDLKSTSKEVTNKGVYYAIKNYRYELQAAHYVAGLRANLPFFNDDFTLGWCEKVPPFAARHSVFTGNTREKTDQFYRDLMIDIAYSIQNDNYPGPGQDERLEIELYDY